MKLGDAVERALHAVGITHDRVSRWLGTECGCEERKQRLNQLGAWASRWLRGNFERGDPKKHPESVMLDASEKT